jgi:hypothetical protein
MILTSLFITACDDLPRPASSIPYGRSNSSRRTLQDAGDVVRDLRCADLQAIFGQDACAQYHAHLFAQLGVAQELDYA